MSFGVEVWVNEDGNLSRWARAGSGWDDKCLVALDNPPARLATASAEPIGQCYLRGNRGCRRLALAKMATNGPSPADTKAFNPYASSSGNLIGDSRNSRRQLPRMAAAQRFCSWRETSLKRGRGGGGGGCLQVAACLSSTDNFEQATINWIMMPGVSHRVGEWTAPTTLPPVQRSPRVAPSSRSWQHSSDARIGHDAVGAKIPQLTPPDSCKEGSSPAFRLQGGSRIPMKKSQGI
ncbi:uncharacterized protein BCR38DRAFT_472154 [Pseudomassariella vexata]|uniref:Uncharacterized protein n=1 Tax=Pseudomassariella vexata TaxID=1141098 RepID=A0A1Y2EAM7_9PEZI|nr:uncharacterized protein BCR38DRAFT_472154 [Pseudomassariella vexata]ORY68640.1 hypothetical protein BCR38DRAFT_472154 [Pseudomassariella vexata]